MACWAARWQVICARAVRFGYIEYSVIYGLMTALCGLVTYFGLVSDPSAKDSDGMITDKQVRFSITSALLVVFLVYYCTTAYWNEKEKTSEYFKLMFPAFIQFLMVVLAFYFGASAAVDIFEKKKRKDVAGNADGTKDTSKA
jgi:hypothetical protein